MAKWQIWQIAYNDFTILAVGRPSITNNDSCRLCAHLAIAFMCSQFGYRLLPQLAIHVWRGLYAFVRPSVRSIPSLMLIYGHSSASKNQTSDILPIRSGTSRHVRPAQRCSQPFFTSRDPDGVNRSGRNPLHHLVEGNMWRIRQLERLTSQYHTHVSLKINSAIARRRNGWMSHALSSATEPKPFAAKRHRNVEAFAGWLQTGSWLERLSRCFDIFLRNINVCVQWKITYTTQYKMMQPASTDNINRFEPITGGIRSLEKEGEFWGKKYPISQLQ